MLILKLLSLIDKHLQQFFDAYYIMINHKIRYYLLQTLHNLNINANAKKLNFKLWSTHSLIAFPIYEPHRRASALYSNNLYKKTAFFIFFFSLTQMQGVKIIQEIQRYTEENYQWEMFSFWGKASRSWKKES